jgi:hypothetical protein
VAGRSSERPNVRGGKRVLGQAEAGWPVARLDRNAPRVSRTLAVLQPGADVASASPHMGAADALRALARLLGRLAAAEHWGVVANGPAARSDNDVVDP